MSYTSSVLDVKTIRENPEKVKKSIRERGLPDEADVDKIVEFDARRRAILQDVEALRGERNDLNMQVVKAAIADKARLLSNSRVADLKRELSEKELELSQIDAYLDGLLLKLPNLIHDDVPMGKDESANQLLRQWGKATRTPFTPKDHLVLGEALDIIDTKKAAEVSGSGFAYLKNEAVQLQFALIQLVLTTLADQKVISELAEKVGNPSDKVFTPIIPPVMIKEEVMKKMDRFDPVEERYYFPNDKQLLVGSAEHTMGPYHMDETLPERDLPLRYVGYSTSFRREAGSYGKDVKGIFRLHQFDKLEMETFCLPENGEAEQELLVAIQEYLLQQLEIPYQVVVMCTGDMGNPDYRQIDVDSWTPSQERYRELMTSDYMTDYQSRRLNTRYTGKGGKGFVHMNDATAIAVGRTLVAILENNQQKDGSVKVPEVLRPYVGKISEIKPKTAISR